jgi:hypothetical protein
MFYNTSPRWAIRKKKKEDKFEKKVLIGKLSLPNVQSVATTINILQL